MPENIVGGTVTVTPNERDLLAVHVLECARLNSPAISAHDVRPSSPAAEIRLHFDCFLHFQ
jgi:hypothetical protein